MGAVTFTITERTDKRITFNAEGSPVPMTLNINLTALNAESTDVSTSMNVEIPAFMKSMLGGTLQKAVDQFGTLIQQLV